MNKKATELKAIIAERKAKNKETINKLEAEIRETSKRLEDINSKMSAITDADQYRELVKQRTEESSMLEFFQMRKKSVEAEHLTDAEYKRIVSDARAEFEALKMDYSKKIFPEIDKIMHEFSEYLEKVTDLNTAIQEACTFAGKTHLSFVAGDIATFIDPQDPYHYFLDAYLRYLKCKSI